MDTALSVKGFWCQAWLCGLSWEQWEPLNTSKHAKCTILPWLHTGAHAGHDTLGYVCLKRTIREKSDWGGGGNPHFKFWSLTFNHVILSGNPSQHRQLTTPLQTVYAGQKQLCVPFCSVELSPAADHLLTVWHRRGGRLRLKEQGTGDDSVPSQPSHFLSSASLEWTPLHPWHLPLPLG